MTILDKITFSINTLLGDPLVSRLFFLSVEIILMAALALLIIRVMRIKSMRFVALVWLLVLSKPILGLFMDSPFHLVDFQKPAPVVIHSSSDARSNLDDLIANQMEKDQERPSTQSTHTFAPLSTDATSHEIQEPMEPKQNSRVFFLSLGKVLKTFWFAGVVLFFILTLVDQFRIRRLKKSAFSPSGEVEKLYDALAKEMGISRVPKLMLSSVLESPALVGVFNPIIFLPQWLDKNFDYSQLKWLMRHELTHWKHKDSLGLLVRRISEILFFFHPAVWWVGRRWEEAMELACDRALLHSEPEARYYAEHLYRLLENQQARRRVPLSSGLFATRTQIGKRIAALLSNPLKRPARLGALSISALFILAILGFTLGLGFERETGAQEAGNSKIQTLSSEQEQKIREKISAVRSDLKSLTVAMESYHVDFDACPLKIHALTTPIAYMTRIPPDLFAIPETGVTAPESQTLRLNIAPDYKSFLLYSIGPDGADQKGNLFYDPTNGATSSGDIIQIVDLGDQAILQIKDRELRKMVDEQKNALLMVKSALESWFIANRNLPDSLNALFSPTKFIRKIPEDMFAPGNAVSYIYDKEGGIALIYSIGPDKVDNYGSAQIVGFYEEGEIPKGDIALELELAELEERHPQNISSKALKDDVMMQDLLKMKEKDGKDNALIHYQMASKIMPSDPNHIQQELINKILKQGWDKSADELVPYINSFKPMFEEIRKGTALDYAKNVGWERGPATPVPNFFAAQISAKMLCVEGRYLESQGKYGEALDNYLTALTMGRDYGAPYGTLISALISIAIENRSLRQIYNLASSGNLQSSELERLLDRIKVIEDTTIMAPGAMAGEANCQKWIFKKMRENPEDINKNIQELEKEFGVKRDQFAKSADLWEAEHDKLWNFQMDYIKKPYWERNQDEFQKKLDEMLSDAFPINKIAFLNFHEADVRTTTAFSRNRETQIAVALELFKSQKGHYPATLIELVPKYFTNLPVDPFSGKNFVYDLLEKGDKYVLYSLGPDLMDNDAKTLYDPTNGTISSGDLMIF
ncbi:hypothetical protein JW926_11535 [Candidatus Sumerlaeota bacterium]|nr:hypothetical protein [Candidatus Sumerlaeota bacterium]